MIATHCLQSLNKIVSNTAFCNSNCLQCSKFCLRALALSNSNSDKIRNLATNKSGLPERKDLHFDKSDTFGNLKLSLEKVYASSKKKGLTAKHKLHLNKTAVSEAIDSFVFNSATTNSSLDQTDETEQPYSDDDSEDEKTVSFEKKPAMQYLCEMKEFDKNKNLKEALALYSDMKQNGVFPKKYIYTFLIGACGRSGYTKAAFKLFKEMRDRHMEPSSATLTGLFNACAETPFPKTGLEKAHELRNRMVENAWLPTSITYHAMIKAFGRCGDLKTAFQIVDEMAEAKHALTSETFAFLLMSCVSDKEAGFTHAVQVFRKMRKLRISYTKYHYNLLLRTVRECGIGQAEISSQLLFDWYFQSRHKNLGSITADNCERTFQLNESSNNELATHLDNSVESEECKTKIFDHSGSNSKTLCNWKTDTENKLTVPASVPNLLATRSLPGNGVIGLENVHTANDRFLLIGGMEGVLSSMMSEKVKPDIKTISIMLDCIPATCDAEQQLLNTISKYNIKPDIDFFNLIIKRRNIRNQYIEALEILEMLPQYGLNIDIATYGVLALGCDKRELGNKLLYDMKAAGFQPNIEVIGTLISNAAVRKDFRYLIDMMNATKELGIKPDPTMLQDLERARRRADKLLAIKDCKTHSYPETIKWCRIFCLQYKPWLQSIEVELPQHPWKQFKVSNNKIL